MATFLRPLLLGGVGGAMGWKLSSFLDITYQEQPQPVSEATTPDSPSMSPDPVNLSPDPLATGRAVQILKFGAPREGVPSPMVYKNHVLAYDSARKVPRWVAEHLTKDQLEQEVASRKGVSFGPDPGVPGEYTSSNKDYWGSGWSRGHMAPAGNNKHCQESMKQTFLLTNVVPQDIDNNGNYWNRLEIYCRKLARQYQDVWVTSGPLFLPQEAVIKVKECDAQGTIDTVTVATVSQGESPSPSASVSVPLVGVASPSSPDGDGKKRKVKPPRPVPKTMTHQVIGHNMVSVPTHLYKVIVASDPSLTHPLLAAFIVPNCPVEDKPLTEFKVELRDLERFSGLSFLPLLDRGQVGDLCLEQGCRMQDYKEFQQFFWTRRLSSPWNMRSLERDWAEAVRKGLVGPELEKVYQEARGRMMEKEQEGNQAPAA